MPSADGGKAEQQHELPVKGAGSAVNADSGGDLDSPPADADAVTGVSSVNPFVPDDDYGASEKLKVFVASLLLLPLLRFVLLVLFVLACSIYCKLGLCLPVDSTLRAHMRGALWIFPRSLLFVLGFVWIPRLGNFTDDDTIAPVVIANHVSYLDVVVLLATIPERVSFLSKASILDVLLIGNVAKFLRVIGVDRTDELAKKKAKDDMIAFVASPRTPPLLVFPEGTTTRMDTIVRYKPGAFMFGASIRPYILHYDFSDSRELSTTATIPPKLWLLRLLAAPFHFVCVERLSVYAPSKKEAVDVLLYAENLRTLMVSKIPNCVAVPQSMDDFLIWKSLLNCHKFSLKSVPPLLVDFSMMKLRKWLCEHTDVTSNGRHVNLTHALKCAEQFTLLSDGSFLSADSFAEYTFFHGVAGGSNDLDVLRFACALLYFSDLTLLWPDKTSPKYTSRPNVKFTTITKLTDADTGFVERAQTKPPLPDKEPSLFTAAIRNEDTSVREDDVVEDPTLD